MFQPWTRVLTILANKGGFMPPSQLGDSGSPKAARTHTVYSIAWLESRYTPTYRHT